MGTRGPIPKRAEDRRGHRARYEDDKITRLTVQGTVEQPAVDPAWHPIAKQLWAAMGESGQARFYEPSDWAVAYSLMDDLSYYKRSSKRSAQMLQSMMSALASLLLSEGDRRRVALELQRTTDESDDENKVAVMDKWRQRLE